MLASLLLPLPPLPLLLLPLLLGSRQDINVWATGSRQLVHKTAVHAATASEQHVTLYRRETYYRSATHWHRWRSSQEGAEPTAAMPARWRLPPGGAALRRGVSSRGATADS